MAMDPVEVMARDEMAAPRTPVQQNFLDRLQATGLGSPFPIGVYRVMALVKRKALKQAVFDDLKKNFPTQPPYARVVATAWINEQYGVADRTAIAQPFSPTGAALPVGTVGFELDTAIFPMVKPVLQNPTTKELVSVPAKTLLDYIQLPPPPVQSPVTPAAADPGVTGVPEPVPQVQAPVPQIKPVFFQQSQIPGTTQTRVEVINPNQQPAAAGNNNTTLLIAGAAVLLVLLLVVE